MTIIRFDYRDNIPIFFSFPGPKSHEFGSLAKRAGHFKLIDIADFRDGNAGWIVNDSALFEVEMFDVEVVEHN